MTERGEFSREEQQLNSLLAESQEEGRIAKQLLLKILSQKLPYMPQIKAYDPGGFYNQTKMVDALLVERGGHGKEFAWHHSKIPDLEPLVAITNEGIFRAPVRAAGISTNYSVLAADWENKEELTPLEYLGIAFKANRAIDKEAEKLAPVG